MKEDRYKSLAVKAAELRIMGLAMVQKARSGHIGGAFSLSEVMSALYFDALNIDAKRPSWEDRDRVVMSKGHATVALYPVLAMRGFFPVERLDTFRRVDGALSGHAEMNHVPGVDMSTGSLGQGLSAAVGMALAAKCRKKSYCTYAILGDGEIQEGQVWEALMFAAAHRLDNLIAILDCNKVQLDGAVENVLETGDLAAKFISFGFHTISIDGHDVRQILEAVAAAKSCKGKPHMIIANTVKGKGVSFMEGKSVWHGKTPDDEQFALAFQELNDKKEALTDGR